MLQEFAREDRGIATFEFAVTVLLLMTLLLGLLTALDAAYIRTVTEHVATVVGRQAIYKTKNSWNDAINAGREMMADNPGVRPATAVCAKLCDNGCGGSCEDPSPATCITIRETHHPLLNVFNSAVEVSVTHYVSIPVISQNRLFPERMQCIKMGATYYVNKWNSAIIFNAGQR